MYQKSIFFLSLFSFAILSSSRPQYFKIEAEIQNLITRFLPNENGKQFLQLYEESLNSFTGFNEQSFLSALEDDRPTSKLCHVCDKILKFSKLIPNNLSSVEFLKNLLCSKIEKTTSISISKRECIGIIDRFGPAVLYILNNAKVPFDEGCSVLFGHECATFLNRTISNWTYWELKIPPRRIEFKPANVKNQKNQKILHLTDIHLDLFYTSGSNYKCNEPLCCRSTSYIIGNHSFAAGYWGEINDNCDMPLKFVQNAIKHIFRKHPDIDLIFWSGDNVPHDIWNTSKEMCLKNNKILANLIRETFQGVPVFPALGNHDTHPVNMYVPIEVPETSNYSMKWLYETMADQIWSHWLTEDNRATFKKGGYYSLMINPGWKVIVLNSNIGYKANFWRYYDPVDPDGQLSWLIRELDHAERIGAHVTIIGHLSPNSIYDAWVHNYIRIVDRYSHVITAAFNGHTHCDEIAIMYNEQSQPVGINFISGSLTSYSNLNPTYKIFEMNSRGQPMNYDVYFLDLDHENNLKKENRTQSNEPVWLHEFNAKESYRLEDLSTSEWVKFIDKAEKDLDISYMYSEHYHRHSIKYLEINNLILGKIQSLVKKIKIISPFSKYHQ